MVRQHPVHESQPPMANGTDAGSSASAVEVLASRNRRFAGARAASFGDSHTVQASAALSDRPRKHRLFMCGRFTSSQRCETIGERFQVATDCHANLAAVIRDGYVYCLRHGRRDHYRVSQSTTPRHPLVRCGHSGQRALPTVELLAHEPIHSFACQSTLRRCRLRV